MADRVDVPPRAFWATHGLALKANVPAKTGGNPQGGSGVLGHSDERDAERDMTQCMVRPCVARELRRVGDKRSCINVSGL
jgi:hypothetical protein